MLIPDHGRKGTCVPPGIGLVDRTCTAHETCRLACSFRRVPSCLLHRFQHSFPTRSCSSAGCVPHLACPCRSASFGRVEVAGRPALARRRCRDPGTACWRYRWEGCRSSVAGDDRVGVAAVGRGHYCSSCWCSRARDMNRALERVGRIMAGRDRSEVTSTRRRAARLGIVCALRCNKERKCTAGGRVSSRVETRPPESPPSSKRADAGLADDAEPRFPS